MQPDSPTYRVIRKLLPYTTAALALVVIYVIWIFISRWNENRQIEHQAEQQQAEKDQEFAKTYGGSEVKILNFYVTPGIVARGKTALLCYGVVNAKTVRVDPSVERLSPAVSYCFEVKPTRETRYTLTAEDGKGHTATESVVLQVK